MSIATIFDTKTTQQQEHETLQRSVEDWSTVNRIHNDMHGQFRRTEPESSIATEYTEFAFVSVPPLHQNRFFSSIY